MIQYLAGEDGAVADGEVAIDVTNSVPHDGENYVAQVYLTVRAGPRSTPTRAHPGR